MADQSRSPALGQEIYGDQIEKVNMIMGGLLDVNDSVRSIKQSERKAVAASKSVKDEMEIKYDEANSITFTDDDTHGVNFPHNDPLVIALQIADCTVSRILVDTGSSVNLIFRATLIRMELTGYGVKPSLKPLTGFDGASTVTTGTIKLPVYVGGMTRIIKFLVIDKPAIYNIILGTPWLHEMKAIPSTYHQCVKFPAKRGTYTIKGDQRESRTCFIAELKLRKTPTQACLVVHSNSEEYSPPKDQPDKEMVEQVRLDEGDPVKCIRIGVDLPQNLRISLIALLKENIATFAWTAADMPGIDPNIACHELNVNPTFKPIKQKRRKLGAERARAVNDEVERLLRAGSIATVRYPDWLANPVVVKKKNGKWRVCIDFTDLNKACPKDSYPVPHIDQLVEATAGHELLSFMDAFSGYNQIMMHPDDRDKTSFITERGTYSYKVMPFGLKNAGATYQRVVNRMFAEQLGNTMEVYIDDMLVKSKKASEHVDHLRTCFETLNKFNMKLNPAKCTFGVNSGEFLGYIVTQRGIEANPKQISALTDLPSPKSTREVQRLTGRIAALNRFISRSTDKCLPFYQLLRGNKRFEWDERCETAFKELKEYLATPPILAKPEDGETLFLYIAVSESAVSSVLVREDRGEQKPVFYISKALNGAESRYPALEKLALAVVTSARKLRPYFQSHSVVVLSNQPLRSVLHGPSQSGRLAKWAVELSEHDIEYKGRTTAKSQVLADFLVELPQAQNDSIAEDDFWELYVDGSATRHGSGVGVSLRSPTGEILDQSFRLAFPASNNEAEYEALIAGMRLAKGIGARKIRAFSDSQLVTSQYSGEFDTKDERMDAYRTLIQTLGQGFEAFFLAKIPRAANSVADALANLASTSDPTVRRTIPVESIDSPSIGAVEGICAMIEDAYVSKGVDASKPESASENPPPCDWREEILCYIIDGAVPASADKWAIRRLKHRASSYNVISGTLYKRDISGVLLRCVDKKESELIIAETHEGAGGSHSSGRALALQIKKQGFYWPNMLRDCEQYAARCEMCQRHGPMINAPAETLTTGAAPYPFMRWAMDIVGPLPTSRGKRFLLVLTDYFTKWVEAEAYGKIEASDVQKFVWKHIICRHGLPYEIVTDNGSQFISTKFEGFCARWNIRLNKSTPRYPQGNGQAEATNRRILESLKKRLEDKKGLWADELDGVLWSHRTTPRRSTGQTPFSLSHGMEAMTPAEASVPTLRRAMLTQDTELNERIMRNRLDELEELRDQALLRIQNYQQQATRYYNKKVHGRHFTEGDLVLRKVFENTAEKPITKLGANWEGPYLVSKVVKPGVYELITMDGSPIPHSWNAANLKRFYY